MKKIVVLKKVHHAARSSQSWEKLLLRWSGWSSIPEARLICAVISSFIAERLSGKEDSTNTRFFEDGVFDSYCRVIGLDPTAISEQIQRSADYFRDVDMLMMQASDSEATSWLKGIAGKEIENVEL